MAKIAVIGIGGITEKKIKEVLSGHDIHSGDYIQSSTREIWGSDVAIVNAFEKDRKTIEESLSGKEILCIYPEGDGMCAATKLKANGARISLHQRFPLKSLGTVIENRARI